MAMDGMMGGGPMGRMGETMDEGVPPEPTPEAAESSSIFLTKENLGGRTVKVGDVLSLTVADVDPETGDVQAELSTSGATQGTFEEDFDRAVPEESEEY